MNLAENNSLKIKVIQRFIKNESCNVEKLKSEIEMIKIQLDEIDLGMQLKENNKKRLVDELTGLGVEIEWEK